MLLAAALGCGAANAAELKYTGRFLDGPLAGKTVTADCTCDDFGDPYEQKGPCIFRLYNPGATRPYRVYRDDQAVTKVVHQGHAINVGGSLYGLQESKPVLTVANILITFINASGCYPRPVPRRPA